MGEPAAGGAPRGRRLDLRAVPSMMIAWIAALACGALETSWCLVVAGTLAAGGGLLLALGYRQRRTAPRARTVTVTFAVAGVLGAAVAVHCAVAVSKREVGPLAHVIQAGGGVVMDLLVTDNPREAPSFGHEAPSQAESGNAGEGRWMVSAALVDVTSSGTVVRGSADIAVLGGEAWRNVHPGDRVRTTGVLKDVREGQSQTAVLSASSAPQITGASFDIRGPAGLLRESFLTAARWLPGDAAGLLPGMVIGDTSGLPESLNTDMKTTGMTHLTAVSGANCSLVLGGFVLMARCLRLSRPVAAILASCGLVAFVVMVGPDPSVMRAALMGGVGLASLVGGWRGRSLTFLCLSATMLLLMDPPMASNIGFLLSVLATLGIVLLAVRIAAWIPPRIPRWVAVGFAVPLSAQLLCTPVIVALQPQFTPYALLANIIAGPLVAPVTVLGTIAVPVSAVVPGLAWPLVAGAGTCAALVAATARFIAGLPGAALPWAEGFTGVAAMAVFSGLTLAVVWLLLHPRTVMVHAGDLHGRITAWLERHTEPRNVRSGRAARGGLAASKVQDDEKPNSQAGGHRAAEDCSRSLSRPGEPP
ncbi:ComEC/Rec2 family competence protein [Arthrobacter sp. SIMBA_036]|uniref:ComEC/Rec2 family competence protein n=1 Tax=Arthrobacter sp. SIMBA_036 TaxID=3085778 RepID=UPI0039781D81